MAEKTQTYRCDARDFVSDLLAFAKDQIRGAIDDPLDQFAATDAASGVVAVIRNRLVPENDVPPPPENEVLLAHLLLALQAYIEKDWEEPWGKLTKMPREEFAIEAMDLLTRIDLAKRLCDPPENL
jgi:hypothetical protein